MPAFSREQALRSVCVSVDALVIALERVSADFFRATHHTWQKDASTSSAPKSSSMCVAREKGQGHSAREGAGAVEKEGEEVGEGAMNDEAKNADAKAGGDQGMGKGVGAAEHGEVNAVADEGVGTGVDRVVHVCVCVCVCV